jgi:small subunit ribosomal protein S10
MPTPKKRQSILIRLKAFDYNLLDATVSEIIDAIKRTGAVVIGPVPLPTEIIKYDLLSSPHVNKTARDQIEMRVHKRMFIIIDPSDKTLDAMSRETLPSGVEVKISLTLH